MEFGSLHNRLLAWTDRLGSLIDVVAGAFCVLFFAGLVIVMLAGVFFRYVLNSPLDWTEELCRWLWLALSFLAISIALRRNEHIGVTFIVEMMPPKVTKGLNYLVDLLTALFLIVLIRQSFIMATNTIMTGGALRISMFWPYLTLVVGTSLTLVQLILRFIKKIVPQAVEVSQDI